MPFDKFSPFSGSTLAEFVSLPLQIILDKGESLRQGHSRNSVELCAIINIRSGNCGMDCKFCAQSRHYPTNAQTWGLMSGPRLKDRVLALARLPLAHIGLVTSGAALNGIEFDALCEIFQSLSIDIAARVCLSLGRLSSDQLKTLASLGLRRYHHNLETSREFYPQICSSQTWESRRQTALAAMDAGLELCCGAIFGLGESWEDRLSLAHSLRECGIKNVPMNFLDPIPGTPFAERPIMETTEALRLIALFRHVLPDAVLRVCGGRLKTFGQNQHLALKAGANALMAGDFLTTRGNALQDDLDMLAAHGFVSP